MLNYTREKIRSIAKYSERITHWIGSEESILLHTLFFVGIFALRYLNFTIEEILLLLTTVVSLEAIYLAIFIQMTVNRHTVDIEDIQEDVQELSEDVGGIEENIEDISEDIDRIQEEDVSEEEEEKRRIVTFEKIEGALQKLLVDVETLKNEIKK